MDYLMRFSLILELFSIIIKNERLKAYIFKVILSSTLIFMVVRFYFMIGINPVLFTWDMT